MAGRFVKYLPIILIALAIVSFIAYIIYSKFTAPITHYNFNGNELAFRDDLRLAKNITVYPNEKEVLSKVWSSDIQNITIAYTNTPDVSLVAVNAFEITYKLSIAYQSFGWAVGFKGQEINSTDELNASDNNLVVFIMPPSIAKETLVKVDGNVITIEGIKSRDLDLAVIKFIMASLNITIT